MISPRAQLPSYFCWFLRLHWSVVVAAVVTAAGAVGVHQTSPLLTSRGNMKYKPTQA
jgi:hypothetical protein